MKTTQQLLLSSLQSAIVILVALGFTVMPFAPVFSSVQSATAATSSSISGDVAITAAMPEPNSSGTEYVTVDNQANSDVDINGWVINDGQDHTVSASSTLSSGSSATICSTPASSSSCTSGYAASGLGLNNDGDTITLSDDGTQIATASYDSSNVSEGGEVQFSLSSNNNSGSVENDDTGKTFQTIQEAIDDNDTDADDTIKVESGDYNETVTVDVSGITLEGPNIGTPGDGSRNTEAVVNGQIKIDANGVVVDGFKVSPSDPGDDTTKSEAIRINGGIDNAIIQNNIVEDFARTSGSGFFGVDGINIFGGDGSDSVKDPTVRDNLVQGLQNSESGGTAGISVQGNVEGAVVKQNVIKDIGQQQTPYGFGVVVRGTGNTQLTPTDVTITNNDISDVLSDPSSQFFGVGFGVEASGASEITANGNNISNTELLLEDKTATLSLDKFASKNTLDRGALLKNVDVDGDTRNIIFNSIQSAIDHIGTTGGDTIQVLSGAYQETGGSPGKSDVLVDKSLTLEGANAGVSGSKNSRGPESIIDSTDQGFRVTAPNVEIDGFKILSEGTSGVYLSSDAQNFNVKNSIVEDTGTGKEGKTNGVRVEGVPGTLEDNLLEANQHGVLLANQEGSTYDVSVEGNKLKNNILDGIYIVVPEATNATVVGNTFSGTLGEYYGPAADDGSEIGADILLQESGDGVSDNIEVKHNNLLSDYGVRILDADSNESRGSIELDADRNWWESTDGPSGDSGEGETGGAKVSGSISYSPWLCDKYEGGSDPETTTDGKCDQGSSDAATSTIEQPAENETVIGTTTLSATYDDKDDEDGNESVAWAVRPGSCGTGGETLFGNVRQRSENPTLYQFDDGSQFTADINTDSLEPGKYCFIFNPKTNSGEKQARVTRNFNVASDIGQCTTEEQKWADYVESYSPTSGIEGSESTATTSIANNRKNSSQATGSETEYDDQIDFVSLGFGGSIILGFNQSIPDGPNDDLRIYETTYGEQSTSTYPETAEVYGSEAGTSSEDFELLGSVTIDEGSGHVDTVDIADGGLSEVRFVKIKDTSDTNDFANKSGEVDGFDVAGVEGLTCGESGGSGQCTPQATLTLDDTGDKGVDTVTQVSINDGTVNSGSSFDMFVSGDEAASNANTSDGEVRIERIATGFKLYFDGVSPGDTQQFKGSIQLRDVDLSGYSTSTISGAPLEDGSNGGFVDEVSVDEQNSKIDFRLRIGGGNDSFVISGLEKSCEPEEPTGAAKITKYSCDPGTQINTDGVTQENVAPGSCNPQSGVKFSATFEDKEGNGGYNGPKGTTSVSASTNESGMVTIDGLSTDGRYLFQELNENEEPRDKSEILHFACEDDTGGKTDNKEISFIDADQTDECVIYNEGGQVAGTSTETRVKGFKYSDDNGDGKFNRETEDGLGGWTIRMYDSDWEQVDDHTTNYGATGLYTFDTPENGTYYVCEAQQEGYTQTGLITSHSNVSAVQNQSGVEDEAGQCYKVVDEQEGGKVPGLHFGNQPDEERELLTCSADKQEITYIDVSDDSQSKIYGLDTNGNANIKQTFRGDYHSVLAADGSKTLYGIENTGGDNNDTNQEPLVTFSSSGTTTEVGPTGLPKPVAMDFAPTGELYVADQQKDQFYEINSATGSSSEIALFNEDKGVDGGDLVVDENNMLTYLHRLGYVFQLDLNTGNWEQLTVENTENDERLDGDFTSLAYIEGTYYALDKENNEVDKFEIYDSDTTTAEDEVVYQDSNDVSEASVDFGDATSCLEPPAEEPTGTVEGVKFEDDGRLGVFNDTDDERLEGWQIIALGDESTNLIAEMAVEADSEDGSTVTGLNPGEDYLVIAEGRYSFDDNTGDSNEFSGGEDNIADAEYYSIDGFDTRGKDASTESSFTTITNSGGLDLVTSENPNPNWGDYSTSSQYSIIDNASGSSVDFYIDDTNYDDNSGSLDVRVYKLDGFSTTTDSDGEYQLELPAGTYEIVEVLQDGYEQTFRSEGADEVVITDESEEEINFGNDSLDPEDDSEDGDDTTDENDQGSDAGESTGGSEPSDGGGGGGALSPGGAGDDGSDAGDDEGSVLGEQDTNGSSDSGESGSDDVTDEDILNSLTTLANALGDLQDSLGGQVAGVQDPLGFPDAGEGSLNRVAQAGAENAPADIDPTENVSTTTVDPSEVSTSSAATSSATSTESDNEDTTTTSVDDSRTGGFGWGFWVALIGLVIIAFLLYRSADEDSDDPINQETVQ